MRSLRHVLRGAFAAPRLGTVAALALGAFVLAIPTALAHSPGKEHGGPYGVLERFGADDSGGQSTTATPSGVVAERFRLLGHNDLGAQDSNGDVWVHGDFAYVGTWSSPCNGGHARERVVLRRGRAG